MPRRAAVKTPGVWEKDPGSNVWWIRYRVGGVLKREKVGRKGDAIDLYRKRKADYRAGIKLPRPAFGLHSFQVHCRRYLGLQRETSPGQTQCHRSA